MLLDLNFEHDLSDGWVPAFGLEIVDVTRWDLRYYKDVIKREFNVLLLEHSLSDDFVRSLAQDVSHFLVHEKYFRVLFGFRDDHDTLAEAVQDPSEVVAFDLGLMTLVKDRLAIGEDGTDHV